MELHLAVNKAAHLGFHLGPKRAFHMGVHLGLRGIIKRCGKREERCLLSSIQ